MALDPATGKVQAVTRSLVCGRPRRLRTRVRVPA